MDLSRHLRYFVVVAEQLHFTRAAELLGIAQPPLSQAMRRLERELDVDLFHRSPHGTELTTAGRLLLDEARALLAAETRLRTLMRKVRDGDLGTLRTGVPPDVPAALLHELLRRCAEQAPGLDIDLHEAGTTEQLRLLTEGRLDVGLVHPPVDATGLTTGPRASIPLGVVLPRTSPLARLDEIGVADLDGHALILAPRDGAPGWHDHLLDTCRTHGFVPARIRHAQAPEFLLGLVLAGHGVALQPESVAHREPRVAWRPLEQRPLHLHTAAVWPRRGAHPAAAGFADLVIDVLSVVEPPALIGHDRYDAARPWTVVYPR
uniref:Transcriptional regulater n=1 Tax=uncultured bacterium BAC AB649/1850 TaxID=1037453 RepID=F6K0V7_9BACT|nr:transcriptional regulater [uncultured bacterium BAC AB649/1850]